MVRVDLRNSVMIRILMKGHLATPAKVPPSQPFSLEFLLMHQPIQAGPVICNPLGPLNAQCQYQPLQEYNDLGFFFRPPQVIVQW